jgi:hypothetical protein
MNLEIELMSMNDGRSLLTDREREILAGDADVSDNYRYKVQSVARQRVRGIADDVDVLREYEPEIFAELQAIVCENEDFTSETS